MRMRLNSPLTTQGTSANAIVGLQLLMRASATQNSWIYRLLGLATERTTDLIVVLLGTCRLRWNATKKTSASWVICHLGRF